MQSNVAQILPLNLTSPGISGVTGITSMAGDVGDWLFKAQNAVYTKERNIAPRELFFQGPATSYVPIPVTTTYTGSTAGRYFVYGPGAIYDNYGTLLNSLPNGGGTTPVWADNVYWHVCFLNNKYFFFRCVHIYNLVCNLSVLYFCIWSLNHSKTVDSSIYR